MAVSQLNNEVEERRGEKISGCKLPVCFGTTTKKSVREISGSYINYEELTIYCTGGLREGCKNPYSRLVGCIIRLVRTMARSII